MMNELDIQKETELLMAESIIGGCLNKNYVEWSIKLLCNNFESESIYILAGLDDADPTVVEKYFMLTTEELSINIDIDNALLLDRYMIHLVEKSIIVRKDIDKTIEKLKQFIDNTSYSRNPHFDFLYLYDELEELTQIPKDEYVMVEFQSFLKEIKQWKQQ